MVFIKIILSKVGPSMWRPLVICKALKSEAECDAKRKNIITVLFIIIHETNVEKQITLQLQDLARYDG